MSKQKMRALASAFLAMFLILPVALWAEFPPLQGNPPIPGGGGGGGSPTGSAGGDLGGSYPNPLVVSVADVIFGVLGVPYGGSGTTTIASNGLMVGRGTSAVMTVAAVASGSALLSNGTSSDPQFVPMGRTLDILGSTPGAFLQRSATTSGWAQHTLIATDLPAHASRHNAGGADAMAIDASAGTGSLRTVGTGALQACAGNDSRLSNTRTPSAHASTHTFGGSDQVASVTPGTHIIPMGDSSGKLTAWIANMVGDSGSGGTAGLVPAPSSGDAAAGKVLTAGGTWLAPSVVTPIAIPGANKALGNASIPTGGSTDLAICFDGTNIWAGASGGVIQIINASTRKQTTYAAAGGGVVGDFVFDGTFVWAVDGGNNRILKFNASTKALVATITGHGAGYGGCFDGTNVWVTDSGGVIPINATTNVVGSLIACGTSPTGCCFDGANIWVCNSGTNTVSEVNVGTLSVVSTTSVSTNPTYCCFDGTYVWIGCTTSSRINQVKASTHTLTSTLFSANEPQGKPFFDGSSVWFAEFSGVLEQVDPLSGTITGSTTLVSSGNFWSVCSDGVFLWLNDYGHTNTIAYNPNQYQEVHAFKAGLTAASTLTSFTSSVFDSDYLVSGQVNVTAATAVSTSISITYTDVGSTSRTMILPLTGSLGGGFVSSGLVVSTGAFSSPRVNIRVKGGSTISAQTSSGTFTGVTYSASALVEKVK